MAENSMDPEDFSALWGAQDDGGLAPARPEVSTPDPASDHPGSGNADRPHMTIVDQEVRDGVARLAQAIAVNQVDVVRKGDLEALRTDLEGTFTHQLAVALYEVLAASNDRFASAEDRMTQRVTEAMEAHGARLVTSMEDCQLVSMESAEAMRSELTEMRGRLNGPLDALASFQRDLRHEVGRLGDVLAGEGAALAGKADAAAEKLDTARRELADRFERGDARAEDVAGQLGGVSEALGAMKEDVSALREEIAELRQTLASSEGRARKAHRWRRSG